MSYTYKRYEKSCELLLLASQSEYDDLYKFGSTPQYRELPTVAMTAICLRLHELLQRGAK